jgi:membrane protein DedA with SNARE-associated domain
VIDASISSALLHDLHRLPALPVYFLVGLLVFSEAALFVGFILPGETAVLLGGVVASQGHVSIYALTTIVVLCAIAGDSVGYVIGRNYGDQLLKLPIVKKRHEQIDGALTGLRKRGALFVFLGRFTAFLRAVMPGLAGMSRLHYRRFFLANAAGGLLWGLGFSLLGFYAGHAFSRIAKDAAWLSTGLLIVLVAVVTLLHLRKKRHEAS